MLEKMRKQLKQNLIDIGFLPHSARRLDEDGAVGDIDVNIIKCVLTAGLYPNIGTSGVFRVVFTFRKCWLTTANCVYREVAAPEKARRAGLL